MHELCWNNCSVKLVFILANYTIQSSGFPGKKPEPTGASKITNIRNRAARYSASL